MGKLVFHYGAMNSGKSLELMKFKYNLEQAGKRVCTLLPDYDEACRTIKSRAMKEEIKPDVIGEDTHNRHVALCDYLLVDEAQFLTKAFVSRLKKLAKNPHINIEVHCYGLLTTCELEMWEASKELMLLADSIVEVKSICERCGNCKAKFHVKSTGGQHDKDTYKSVCWDCWNTENGVLV